MYLLNGANINIKAGDLVVFNGKKYKVKKDYATRQLTPTTEKGEATEIKYNSVCWNSVCFGGKLIIDYDNREQEFVVILQRMIPSWGQLTQDIEKKGFKKLSEAIAYCEEHGKE